MPDLLSSFKIKNIEFKNRIGVSPMCQYSSKDGFADDWHLVHLGSRAVGGAGLVMTEAAAVCPEGRISPGDLGIWKNEHIEKLKQITAFIEAQGAVPAIQLAHAGRKASHEAPWLGGKEIALSQGGWKTYAPSALAFKEGESVPEALSIAQIGGVIDNFVAAALRACKAGFKILELHAAHGYLIHEFLSPLSNKRGDEYGGSFENRIRFLMELIQKVRGVWPEECLLFVRISATDWVEGGWTIKDSVALSRMLKKVGVDLIDCSTGGNSTGVNIPLLPLYQVPFSESIRKEAGIPTAAVGLITTAAEAESIVSEGRADMVFLARELLRDPYFPLRAAAELNKPLVWPVQYERAQKKK
jgi:2,4-dienoyl-CoA reductase-like NADH-dependent reductase (Old Yellow Enzyme family)